MRAREFITLREGLEVDVPNEDWLEDAIAYSMKKGRNSFGVPYMNKVTAYLTGDRYVEIPTKLAASLPGMRGEQQNVRPKDLEAIMKIMKDTGRLPSLGSGKEYYPFIRVAYNGEAWVSEGNHRIMAAAKLGWPTIKVEVQYNDGGERVKHGPLYPGKIGLGNVTEGRYKIEEAPTGLTYFGYPCTKDCSGHRAGYNWAVAWNITDPDDCPYRPSHNSFWEGCRSLGDPQDESE